MDYLDDDEFNPRPAPERPSPITIVAMLAGAGAAVLLLWMNMGLSSRVDSLEQSINDLTASVSDQKQSKDLANKVADLTNQLDSVTQALANHLKSQSMNNTESSRGGLSMNHSLPQATIPSRVITPSQTAPRLPIQPIPGANAPAQNYDNYNSAPAQSYGSYNNGSLPAPISRVDIAPVQQPIQSSGGWVVNITSVSDQESAYQEVNRLRSMVINAESAHAVSNGRTWYRIRIPGFNSHDEAVRARPGLESRLGIRDTWVGQRD